MNYTIIDIETVALDDAEQYVETPIAPANYKDPDKIAAYIAERKQEIVDKAALDVDLCRVVALGWNNADGTGVQLAPDQDHETTALTLFAGTAKEPATVFVGFNLLQFDLLTLIRRCQYLGISLPHVELSKYRTPHIDLMQKLSFDGAVKARSLKFYCKRFGIDVPDEVDGSQIGALVRAGEWGKVEAHCRADVQKSKLLAERLGYLK